MQSKTQNLAEITAIRIGGVAACFFEPTSADELAAPVEIYPDAVIVGGGTNLVFGEMSKRAVISLRKYPRTRQIITDTKTEDSAQTLLEISAAASLPNVVEWAIENGLGGIENLIGIPGTIGGAITMNAGTPDGAIGERVRQVITLDRKTLRKEIIPAKDLDFSYRHSVLQNGSQILLSAQIFLTRGEVEKLRERARIFLQKRGSSKIRFPNCGSVFKNPDGQISAGELLDRCGLKNAAVGNLRISPEHANFFENLGGATFADFLALLAHAQNAVSEKFAVHLQPEVKFFHDE